LGNIASNLLIKIGIQLNFLCYAMLRKKRTKIYAARDFSDKYGFAPFKKPIKFM
jgi:hypothetical protein